MLLNTITPTAPSQIDASPWPNPPVAQPGKKSALELQQNSKQQRLECQKLVESNYSKFVYSSGAVTVGALILGALKWGSSFPAKALEVIGNGFGSITTLAAPFFLAGNEILNFNLLHSKRLNKQSESKNEKQIFGFKYNDLEQGFYRCASAGFFPFIFKPFIDPEQFGKSKWHLATNILNIPNLLFTGYTWGLGNLKALTAWGFKVKEQRKLAGVEKNSATYNEISKRINGYENLYDSAKRITQIGSIANPTLQGLRQFADSMSLISGSMSAGEFFSNPFLAASRLTSLFAGVPEMFAKGVDSLERCSKEFDSIESALPSFLRTPLRKASTAVQKNLSAKENNIFKQIRHASEVTFHTLSPLSMFALFTPLLGESHTHEDAQSSGGLRGALDKIIGGYSKTLTWLFTGTYVAFSRLPQSLFQLAYFSKIGFGKGTEAEKLKAVNQVKEKFINNPFISGLSNTVRNSIEWLVPGFYNQDLDIEGNFQSFDQIQAKDALDQVKDGIEALKSNLTQEDKHILIQDIINTGLEFFNREAQKGSYNLTDLDRTNFISAIKTQLGYRLKDQALAKQLGLPSRPERKEGDPRFAGAEFIVKYLLRPLDFVERLRQIDYRSAYHNMTTAYRNDELYAFDAELMPVVAKCAKGLGSTVNGIFSLAA